jgi:hypothetical protein
LSSIRAPSRLSRWTPARPLAATRAFFARHRTVTTLEHARALRAGRHDVSAETPVEIRPLDRYDQLIA